MHNAVVSVIVAVYQAEAYLHRCVDSILSQTFSDFELLLIDDGSTDKSGEICDEYAKKDSRVRVIYKPNEGLSATRQVGIDHAVGEYTIHCDPDDWMEPDMLSMLYSKAKESDADIVMCDVMLEYKDHSVLCRQYISDLCHKSLLNNIYDPLSASVCNKLVRSTCYKDYGVEYSKEITYAEDLFALLQLLVHPVRVEYVNSPLYHYDKYSNPYSIMRTTSVERIVRSIEYMESKLPKESSTAISKLKRDALVIAYRSGRDVYQIYGSLYREIDGDLLLTGLIHPIKHWTSLVIALQRYRLGGIATIYASFIISLKRLFYQPLTGCLFIYLCLLYQS